MLWGADFAMQKKLKYPLVAESAIWYNIRRQDIRRRLAARPVAPTEWNTTVVAERRCARKGNMFQRSSVLIARWAAVRLRGDNPFLGSLAKRANHSIINN